VADRQQPWHVNDLDHQITEETTVIAGLSWGYNAPGCVVWARILPNYRVYLQADCKFQRLAVEDICVDLKNRATSLGLPRSSGNYADPSLFADVDPEDGVEVEPIADGFARHGFPLLPAHGDVRHGFSRMHDYARAAPDGAPWMVVSPRCTTVIRTLPTLTQSKTDREVLEGEHAYAANAIRALLSSRPAPSAPLMTATYAPGTYGWLRQQMNDIDKQSGQAPGFHMRRIYG
jgi:hypothetical protein